MSFITIYFNDKPVFLCSAITTEIREYMHHPDAVYIDELSSAAINSLLHEIKKPEFHGGILFDADLDHLKKAFFKHFKKIKAGGGLVKNKNNEILMIFRRGKWDLPKGKLDDGETIAECAVREVQEETGLQKLVLQKPAGITYHCYEEFGKSILKESHWFHMLSEADEKLTPQTEEDISEIVWVKKENLKPYLENSFPTIVQLLS
jgi:8-oxo-dGTP pyrophosphatase MutT (NUDIX family)